MTPLAVFILLLLVAAIVLAVVQAFDASLGRAAPGWLAAALVTLALLIANHLPT